MPQTAKHQGDFHKQCSLCPCIRVCYGRQTLILSGLAQTFVYNSCTVQNVQNVYFQEVERYCLWDLRARIPHLCSSKNSTCSFQSAYLQQISKGEKLLGPSMEMSTAWPNNIIGHSHVQTQAKTRVAETRWAREKQTRGILFWFRKSETKLNSTNNIESHFFQTMPQELMIVIEKNKLPSLRN